MWSDLRAEIDQARQRLQLSEQDFAPLPCTTNWAKLEENLYHVFCRLDHPTARPVWLWERFRPGAVGLVCDDECHTRLTSLVDPGEVVWLVLNETVNMGDKFWFYQGTPRAIGRVLAECYYLDEIYLVSKKYAWLLCLNHHDVLFGVGPPMQERLLARGAQPIT
ncbi:DUF6756 family protein [Hymenobacter properus]|uniref:Uncharacterized protein n=1 Tax=Hymenobacter properus TaxID=2791026 RepID=A0A931FP40_9BACT|nr:DUF6756 family protein [Hymenobacter properus]MBF9143249.1 hypothetical protein [Hymenobacter properus]MBR7722059.1 hypothetical protein [Microvirga sp. SRT04]